MYKKYLEWGDVDFNDSWVESWIEGKKGLLDMDWWTWHQEWWNAAAGNPGIIPLCLEDLKSFPLPTLRKLVDQLGWKVTDDVLQKSIDVSFPETDEDIGIFKELLTPAQKGRMGDVHASSEVMKYCPFKSDVWDGMFGADA